DYAEPWVQPLYTYTDVDRVFGQCVSVPYGQETDAARGVRFKFIEAGHILGSAIVFITADGPAGPRTLTFSGDLGRRGMPLLRAASDVPPADVLVSESTYGNRFHVPIDETVD